MTNELDMPPLPAPWAQLPKIVLPEVHGMGPNTVVMRPADVFTAEQVRAYGEVVREATFQQIYERAKSKGWGMRNDDPFEESIAEIWRELEREARLIAASKKPEEAK